MLGTTTACAGAIIMRQHHLQRAWGTARPPSGQREGAEHARIRVAELSAYAIEGKPVQCQEALTQPSE